MRLILYFACLFYGVVGFSQVDSIIFGLSNKPWPAEIYLSKLNPLTGNVTIISPASLSAGENVPNATIDAYTNRFYYINENNHLLGVDLFSGAIITNAPISNSNGSYFDQMIFNQADGIIYGLARKSAPAEVYLAKINPMTGVVTNISSAPLSTGENVPNAAINPFSNTFYYVNEYDAILGVSLVTGNIVSNALITNPNGGFFDQMEFNISDTTIYGLARKSSPAEVRLAKINPVTGVVTNISAASLSMGENIPNSLLDPCNNIYYYINEANAFVGVNCNTGNIVSSTSILNPFGFFSQMTFNYTCYLSLLAFSSVPEINLNESVKVFPNPTAHNISIKSDLFIQRLKLFTLMGKTVIDEVTPESNNIDVSNLSDGIYFLKIETSEGILTKKVVIQK